MKLAWITDAHLNFLPKHADLQTQVKLIPWSCDAILVGGDTAEADSLGFWLMRLADTFKKPVYFVLGNHDFYGSDIRKVHDQVRQLCSEHPHLRWLDAAGVVNLTKTTALVGVGGWGDARYGQFMNSTVVLNDYLKIQDLATLTKQNTNNLRIKLGILGDASATILRESLTEALAVAKRVIVLTHVPPFAEATWHEGENSDWNWVPHFGCKATGDVLLDLAGKHPQIPIHVLCGHTHSAGTFWARPNLLVTTGAAVYGKPAVQPPILVP
jgi:3',5'-cyclic AMP phosphodiesterase CpdA